MELVENMADTAIGSEDDLLREEGTGSDHEKKKVVSVPVEEWKSIKNTQEQLLAAIKAGTLGKEATFGVHGGKRGKADDASDESTDSSDGDTPKQNQA